jgi:hypothetical protein
LASFTSHKRIDIFEAILTELNIAGPKDARQVDIHLLRSFGGPTAAIPDAGREREIPARCLLKKSIS